MREYKELWSRDYKDANGTLSAGKFRDELKKLTENDGWRILYFAGGGEGCFVYMERDIESRSMDTRCPQ